MIKLLKEAIASLEHAQVFISSRQKMHECGRELHQQTIDKLNTELKSREDIEKIKREAEEYLEKKYEALVESQEKCSGEGNGSLEEAIAKLKDAPK